MSNHSFLASDDQNPDYIGANNPDNRLTAQFRKAAIQNNFRSEQEGRPIFEDILMVRIYVPGDQLNVVDTPVRADHKRRFPLQWAHFQNQMEGDQRLAGKTPIDQWPRLTPAQVEELRYLKFLSVEDVANASDGALGSLGMVGGMSPYAFRENAQRFLTLASNDAAAQKSDTALAEVRNENKALCEQMAAMNTRLEAMAAASAPAAPDLAKVAESNSVEAKTARGK